MTSPGEVAEEISRARRLVDRAERVVVLSGAGISIGAGS